MPGYISDRVLRRELGDPRYSKYSSVSGLYGNRQWVRNLDIVNELRGHSGCVNALSWSRSGELLASGSDDLHVNIHKYAPDSTKQFEEVATISTGHSRNIFSVKFMPHSNDRTIVTAAGDKQVRIFDIEYSAQTSNEVVPSLNRNRGPLGFGSRVLTEENANGKIFRCHTDSVKRIVTESSPFFFLTCSEDGDVRQWDSRLPSSAYPSLQGGSELLTHTRPRNVPAPLISYKKYGIDLNTISCSASQPHYIAVGGTHLHCFLHDRRFLGRDLLAERGASRPLGKMQSSRDDDMVSQATQCVRKFAPDGQPRMQPKDSGHITACKISDAYPNELIVSWSGDSIYSFDIISGAPQKQVTSRGGSSSDTSSNRVRESKLRKRKRPNAASHDSCDGLEQATARLRTESVNSDSEEELALRVQYGNGQHEDIPIQPDSDADIEKHNRAREIAAHVVEVRNGMFMFERQTATSTTDLTLHESTFSSILRSVAQILPVVDDVISSWQYPESMSAAARMNDTRHDHRAACRRFLQAAGLLSRVLGGKLPNTGEPDQDELNASTMQRYFTTVGPAAGERDATLLRHERLEIHHRAQFCYDFIKAICLWLDSGIGALLDGFSSSAGRGKRFPIKSNAGIVAVETVLIPYLERLASDKPIINVDVSRFELNEQRHVFATEKAAVAAFAEALKIPFADLFRNFSEDASRSEDPSHDQSQDRSTALRFWAFTVGRGVLMNAAKLEVAVPFLNFELANRAFGGPGRGRPSAETKDAERDFLSRHSDIQVSAPHNDDDEQNDSDAGSYEDYEEDPSSDDEDSEDEFYNGRFVWGRPFERNKIRAQAGRTVQCQEQTRKYSGHRNNETVKDVNFFGRNDEYIVSGSDCGHIFIWDKKTCRVVNILEGDSEVVNVATGHPYEPMLAVSGIDDTIKIFSPDAQAREMARKGIGFRRPARPVVPRLGRRRRTVDHRFHASGAAAANPSDSDYDDAEPNIAPNGLKSRKKLHLEYQITAANNHERQNIGHESFITRSLLAQLALRIEAGDVEGLVGEEGVISQDDCAVQ